MSRLCMSELSFFGNKGSDTFARTTKLKHRNPYYVIFRNIILNFETANIIELE